MKKIFQKMCIYWELTKPNISLLVLVVATWGFYLGLIQAGTGLKDASHWWVLWFHLMAGSFFSSGGVSALNQYLEHASDAKMKRTRNRPIPSGRLRAKQVRNFGISITSAGVLYLYYFVNPVAGVLAFITIALYLFVYTPMKRKSPWSLIIGAVPGALPPVGGWVAATGEIGVGALILFGILFCWQIPHFLAIAILYREDYISGGFTVFPQSGIITFNILSFSFALIWISLSLFFVNLAGLLYGVLVTVIGVIFFFIALATTQKQTPKFTRRLLIASIVYLPVLLAVSIIDQIIAV